MGAKSVEGGFILRFTEIQTFQVSILLEVKTCHSSKRTDDLIMGTDDVDSALSLQQDLIDILKKGGFTLRMWSSFYVCPVVKIVLCLISNW